MIDEILLFYLEMFSIIVCLSLMVFLSSVESALSQSNPLTLRMMLERDEKKQSPMQSLILEDRSQFLVPLHLGTQGFMIVIAVLTTHLCIGTSFVWGGPMAFLVLACLSLAFRQLLPRLLTQNEPERKLVSLLIPFAPFYRALRSLALPLSSILRFSKRLHEDGDASTERSTSEATEEEIQAYLDIGEDEGILEKEDSQLIQSVVAFGDTLVREVMTPRTKIVACQDTATIGQLRDIMVGHRHSRIPVYHEDMDHIIGVVYIRHLLAHYSLGRESDPISNIILPATFVPETKPVSTLLKELQSRGDYTAIVIDEFGGVAGLVTIEDLLEEIVGEIRDEDQANVSEVLEESPLSFVFRGSTELYRLEELAGRKFEGLDCATVAGLIVSYLGRVPLPGEEFDLEGLRIQILDSDRKRIHRIRVHLPQLAH